ncbi:MAG: UDP-N-acetylmuramoyl-L-alanyl-D-glutamate--2,6-diaminopimelate ligase [Frisingicoccus sp.]|nr:UDP-N-acetylmuramoyl-L-alanyl-D-glutamate--2,6-diaminopimelate ligase [Frisingicoccus sp.]
MKLSKLLERMEYECVQGSVDIPISHLLYDSRNACPDGVFVCISGAVMDGHKFIMDVVNHGVRAVIVEKDVKAPDYVTVIRVKNTREALAYMSAAYFGYPAEELTTIGITGTKGKTTTTYMVRSILENSGFKTGLIGTIETIIGKKVIKANNTTPESYLIQQYFRDMVNAGCQCVVMEVSSQGLMMHRVDGFTFDYGIFTNLGPDHIGPNEHKDLDDYIHCKSLLFQKCRHGIVNMDDEYVDRITKDHTCDLQTFGMSEKADFCAKDIHLLQKPGILGITYTLSGRMHMNVEIDVPGSFSVYNSLTAIAICHNFNVPEENILKALKDIRVKGRLEIVPISPKFTLMIDYAHNAMALESLLKSLKEYHPKRLVTLFGCGGNRDPHRRFEMGEVSSNLSDLTVVTSDNPRFEEPMDIIKDILVGVKKGPGKYITIPDRKEAIKYCIDHAEEGDVIILAGKGHEDYQEIKGIKYPMDERVLITEILEGR